MGKKIWGQNRSGGKKKKRQEKNPLKIKMFKFKKWCKKYLCSSKPHSLDMFFICPSSDQFTASIQTKDYSVVEQSFQKSYP